jgi:hypothetical protein
MLSEEFFPAAITGVMMNFNFSWVGLLVDLAKAVLIAVVGGVVKSVFDRKPPARKPRKKRRQRNTGAVEDFK